MAEVQINNYIIKIIGLLGDINPKKDFPLFLKSGYKKDLSPVDELGNSDIKKEQFLRDYFYPNFRKIMFLDDTQSGTYRFIKHGFDSPGLLYPQKFPEEKKIPYHLSILSSEIFVFEENFAFFSVSIKINPIVGDTLLSTIDLSNFLSVVRNFNTLTTANIEWHEWLSKYVLCNMPLRGPGVKADEYSGSKFKLFTVIDLKDQIDDRAHLLYDLATSSPLGSASGKTFSSPDPNYYQELFQNRIAVFTNWEALALFDSMTCVGKGQITNQWQYDTWDQTYFRIYMYRLFFKYTLYKYNSAIHSEEEDTVKLRDQFEKFLNRYNISHISFNFLANEIFKKVGSALELESELVSFRETINNLSKTIQEEKQARTNLLLQAVTVLTSITSIGPIFEVLSQFEQYLGWSDSVFYTVLSILILTLGFGVLYFLVPEKLQAIWKKKA